MNNLYVLAGLSMLITFSVAYHYVTINALEKKLLKVQKDLADEIAKSTLYKSSLDTQSAHIESVREDYEMKIEEYKAFTPKVKYRVIYRDVVRDINLTKESSCEDVKNIIDSVRAIDFSSL